jgi:hypothetical protein
MLLHHQACNAQWELHTSMTILADSLAHQLDLAKISVLLAPCNASTSEPKVNAQQPAAHGLNSQDHSSHNHSVIQLFQQFPESKEMSKQSQLLTGKCASDKMSKPVLHHVSATMPLI